MANLLDTVGLGCSNARPFDIDAEVRERREYRELPLETDEGTGRD